MKQNPMRPGLLLAEEKRSGEFVLNEIGLTNDLFKFSINSRVFRLEDNSIQITKVCQDSPSGGNSS